MHSCESSLHSSLSLSRQTWTHSAFSLLTNESESNGSKGQHHSQLGLQQQQQHQTHASRLSLAGVCTVRIGPHLFLDTKFYTVVSSPSTTPIDSNSPAARSTSPSLALKQEPIAARSQSRSHSPQNQVAMEFKENPGKIWLFPPEASVEFSPANDRDSAQISASFQLPIPALSERSERPNRSSLSNQAISMTIMQATSALWEGLELAVSGPHTVITRSPTTKPKSGSSRPHIPSTHSEDTSEVLGSGKTAKQPSPFNGTITKRQQDKAVCSLTCSPVHLPVPAPVASLSVLHVKKMLRRSFTCAYSVHSFVPAIFLIYPHLSRTPLGRPFLQTRKDQATKGSGRQRTRGNKQRTKRNQCCEKGYCLWTGIQLCPKEMWLLQLYYHSHVEKRTQRTQYSVQRLWCQMEARKDHAGCHGEPAGTNVRTRV